MVDQAKKSIEEIGDNSINFENKMRNETFEECVSKMIYLMSDRAANMNGVKQFWMMKVWKHIFATLMLIFYTAADKAIAEKERDLGSKHGPLGRDCLPKFSNFSNSAESAAIRVI